MARTVRLDVVTPERRIWTGDVEMLIARGSEGELGVLPGHTPLITALRDGVLLLRRPDRTTLHIATEGGFLAVDPEGITVLADRAQVSGDADPRDQMGVDAAPAAQV